MAGTCFRCHGGQKEGGKLRVDSREAFIQGGQSGAAIDLKAPDKSLLLAAIFYGLNRVFGDRGYFGASSEWLATINMILALFNLLWPERHSH